MPGKNPSAKTSFRLTPKHLLLAAFIIVAIAITALIVGVFQTLKRPQPSNAPTPATNNTVEIWSPRGANSQAPGTVVNAPNIPGSTPPPVETAPAAATAEPQPAAAAPRRPAPAAAPAQNGERPLQPINKPAPAAAEPAAERPTPAPAPQAAPAPRPRQPAPQPAPRQQPKDVMDNLF